MAANTVNPRDLSTGTASTLIPAPTLIDKLGMIPNTFRILLTLFTRALTYHLRSGPKAPTLYKDAFYAAIRTNLSLVNPAQEQWLNLPTEKHYLDLCKEVSIQPETDVIADGLKMHWFGGKATAEKVVLYLHGGGYVLSASPAHVKWLYELQRDLAKGLGRKVSIVMPGYTLAPHGQFPKQLQEAAASLKYVLETLGKKPSDVILAGDSAGGNLALGLISHLLHPHPDLPKINLSEPLGGMFLISPWTKFDVATTGSAAIEGSDMVCPAASARWSALFMGNAKPDNYSQPFYADKAWFQDLPSVTGDVFIWTGSGELLYDSVCELTQKLKEVQPNIELVVQKGAAHEDMIMEKLIGYKEKAEGTARVEKWLSPRL